MKKLSILLACLMAVFSFSSCEEDTDPRYQVPTKFELNTPALADQLYELTPEGTIDLTWSQPDYGFAAVANYQVEVAIDTVGGGEFITLDTRYTTCSASVKDSQVAEAICKLRGIESKDDYTDEGARELFVRVVSSLGGVESSLIVSNIIVLKQVQDYCAIQSPGYIYLIGNVAGWIGPDPGSAAALEPWKLSESSTAIGSKIYSGVFDMPAGELLFRFYTELTGWDGGASVGMQVEDKPVPVELVDGLYEGNLVAPGKGSVQILDWPGGSMKITVNLSGKTPTMILEAGGVDTNGKAFIYLVGAPEGWAGPDVANADHYEPWKLYDLADNGVYTGTFEIPAGSFMFRFYTALTGWDADSFGSQEVDNPIDITLTDGVYTGVAMKGKGSWNLPDWAGGKVAMEVDVNNGKVTFTQK